MPEPIWIEGVPWEPAGFPTGIWFWPSGSCWHRTIGHWGGDYSVLTRGLVPSVQFLVGEEPGQWAQFYPANMVCMGQGERVLTADLTWTPVGDVEVGDELIGFDEAGVVGGDGRRSKRRWRPTTVLRSEPKRVECVRVILSNGDEIVTTPEHPWLVSRYGLGAGGSFSWVGSSLLMPNDERKVGAPRKRAYSVLKAMKPWGTERTYDAGWLAGMYDGEGSVRTSGRSGVELTIAQAVGPVLDQIQSTLTAHGFDYGVRIVDRDLEEGHEHWKKMGHVYLRGGVAESLRLLGSIRPGRLMANLRERSMMEDVTVLADAVEVVAVEPAGFRDIQEIETTTGTYIGEGYLMHNCYGAAGANGVKVHIEVSGQNGEEFNDWQKFACNHIEVGLRSAFGWSSAFMSQFDGRLWVDGGQDIPGAVNHLNVAYPPNRSYEHYDFWADDYAVTIGGTTTPTKKDAGDDMDIAWGDNLAGQPVGFLLAGGRVLARFGGPRGAYGVCQEALDWKAGPGREAVDLVLLDAAMLSGLDDSWPNSGTMSIGWGRDSANKAVGYLVSGAKVLRKFTGQPGPFGIPQDAIEWKNQSGHGNVDWVLLDATELAALGAALTSGGGGAIDTNALVASLVGPLTTALVPALVPALTDAVGDDLSRRLQG